MDHQRILIRAIRESGLTVRQIADGAGVSESSLSRFVNGKQDLKAGDYFAVLNILPDSAKDAAKSCLSIDAPISLKMLVVQASDEEKAEVLFALGHLLLKRRVEGDIVGLMSAAS